jgi:hypothetical protein
MKNKISIGLSLLFLSINSFQSEDYQYRETMSKFKIFDSQKEKNITFLNDIPSDSNLKAMIEENLRQIFSGSFAFLFKDDMYFAVKDSQSGITVFKSNEQIDKDQFPFVEKRIRDLQKYTKTQMALFNKRNFPDINKTLAQFKCFKDFYCSFFQRNGLLSFVLTAPILDQYKELKNFFSDSNQSVPNQVQLGSNQWKKISFEDVYCQIILLQLLEARDSELVGVYKVNQFIDKIKDLKKKEKLENNIFSFPSVCFKSTQNYMIKDGHLFYFEFHDSESDPSKKLDLSSDPYKNFQQTTIKIQDDSLKTSLKVQASMVKNNGTVILTTTGILTVVIGSTAFFCRTKSQPKQHQVITKQLIIVKE